jgi:hypothetical protein
VHHNPFTGLKHLIKSYCYIFVISLVLTIPPVVSSINARKEPISVNELYDQHYRNSALCRVLGALLSAFCRALGKVLLSVMTTFTESRTLGIERHSAKKPLPSAKHSANGGSRQRVVYSWRPLSLPSVGLWHSAKMLLCRVSHVWHWDTRQSIFLFFLQPNLLWYVPTLYGPTCTILAQL